MKAFAIPLLITALLASLTFAVPNDANLKAIRLKYVKASDIYEVIESSDAELAKQIHSINIQTNSLMVREEAERMETIMELVRAIDQVPTQIQLSTEIFEVQPDGTRKAIARPTIFTLDGKKATISTGDFEIEITPTLIKSKE